MFKPLTGIKVIDLTYFIAGPGAAKILADWGADVIKVEPVFGDPGRTTGKPMCMPTEDDCNILYNIYNANKRGLSLNLKAEDGKAVLEKILETADVFVTSYRTGALKRLGLDYEAMHARYPHIVWGQINGYGDFGPIKDNPGFDTVAFWARSGAMMDLVEKGTSPVNPLIGFGDATTSCSLAAGICGALYNKAKTGEGCKVMVSLFGQAIWSGSAGVASTQYGDSYPKTRLIPGTPVMNTYKSSDDIWFYMSILEPDRYNPLLLKGLGREELIADPAYGTAACKENARNMTKMLSEAFVEYTYAEIDKMLTDEDIAHEKVQGFHDIATDPQAVANLFVAPVKEWNGTETQMAMTPVRFTQVEPKTVQDIAPTVERTAPKVGMHSVEILKEYGYTQAQIDALLASGAVAVNIQKK